MTADSRGKYAGTKLHLDGPESTDILEWYKKYKATGKADANQAFEFCKKVAKAIKKLLEESPDALKDRTPEQIKAAMLKDKAKIEKQLAAGGKWKEVK